MAKFTTPFEIYKLLPQSNCRQCHLPSCLAFATAVLKGEKSLSGCPFLSAEVAAQSDDAVSARSSMDSNMEEVYGRLQQEIAGINLVDRAAVVGGRMVDGRLAVSCLGKDFIIGADGTVTSECHINPWVTVPLLQYVLASTGVEPAGRWVSMRELADGPTWNPLFVQRCETVLQRIADAHPHLFEDLIGIFSGRQSARLFDADISIILSPLPKVPVLICYWRAEDDLDSRLAIFFDSTADRHLSVELLHTLGVGMVTMFARIGHLHG
ncbi:MAG: DUF3786 domain-containing protein [Desulfobulbaceae bacterium]|nr:DUF3786 domain-containing protein [Desulfobulbaceae bacterium]